jgi:hypothetical protein
MVTFNIGDRVMILENNEILKGTVKKNFYEFPEILIIECADGELKKVHIDRVAHEPKSETNDKQNAEPVEKSEITITPDEFKKIGTNLIPTLTKRPIIAIAFTAFLAELHKALFFDEVSENSEV